jgi:hypothetical protein
MVHHPLRSLTGVVLAGCVLSLCSAGAAAAQGFRGYALTNNALLMLDTANPAAAAVTPTPITGILPGDVLVGLDFRPQNGALYGLGYNRPAGTVQLYAISYRTDVASPIGAAATFVQVDGVTPLQVQGMHFGVNFDPTTDRLRVVNDAGQNFRLDPNTGAPIDGDFGGAPGSIGGMNMDGVTSALSGGALSNNEQNATVTTFFTLDSAGHMLFVQAPGTSGAQITGRPVTLNGPELLFTGATGFDIPPGIDAATNGSVPAGSGLAALTVSGVTALYAINLTNAAATLIGPISNGSLLVQGLAIQGEDVPTGLPAIALGANTLLRFNTATPATAASVPVTGLQAGEVLKGLDWRPKTGQLYALGVDVPNGNGSATLYRLDPQTGVAAVVGTVGGIANGFGGPISLDGATAFGFDINPDTDQARVVTNNGRTFRIEAGDGTVVGGALDPGIDGLPAGSTGLTGAAYTSIGTVVPPPPFLPNARLYVLDPTSHMLLRQTPIVGSFLVDTSRGTHVTLGDNVLDFDVTTGFDISPLVHADAPEVAVDGSAYAALTVSGVTSLYRITLLDGRATALGMVAGSPQPIAGLALGDAPLNPTTTTLSASANPGSTAQSVTFTATVAPSTATGTVWFKMGVVTLSNCGARPITAGIATCVAPFPNGGNFTISAVYNGDVNHVISTSSPIAEQITATGTTMTTTALTVNPNPANLAPRTILIASVTPIGSTGLVAFFSDGTPIGTVTVVNGTAALTILRPDISHNITAVFGGDSTFAASTSPVVPLEVDAPGLFTQHFAEGATGSFFHTDLGFVNASATDAATVRVLFFGENGTAQGPPTFTLTPLGRVSIDVNAAVGNASGVSMLVESDQPVGATRQMTWGTPIYGSTLESGAVGAARTWYFAEGATNVFSLFYLIENPNSQPANVTLTHLLEGGTDPVVETEVVPPLSRRTFFINDVPGLQFAALSTTVTSDQPIVAERAMYLNTTGRLWEGGTAGHGATALSTAWSFAEGSTGFFHTYLLMGNPNAGTSSVIVRYLFPNGDQVTRVYDVPGRSRRTVDIAGEDPKLLSASVGMSLTSTLPIVSERAMWWGDPFTDGSASLGSTDTGTLWAIGEGAEGGPADDATFVLVSNTSFEQPIAVLTVTYDDGTHDTQSYVMQKNARLTVRIGDDFPHARGRTFSVLVESGLGDPITVEYARYQSPGGVFADGGGAAPATRIK